MITAYFWLPKGGNVGHTSAQIGCDNERYAAYVSWWPSFGNDPMKASRGFQNSVAGDIQAEGRAADVERLISGLDEAAAAQWWTTFLEGQRANYKLGTTNCSWAVINALKAGGADSHFPWRRILHKYNLQTISADLELGFIKFGYRAIRFFLQTKSIELATKLAAAQAGDDHLLTWSPRDALRYCDSLLAGINDGILPRFPE